MTTIRPLSLGDLRKDLSQWALWEMWEHAFQISHLTRHQPPDSERVDQATHTKPFVDPQGPRGEFHPVRAGNNILKKPVFPRGWMKLLLHRAHVQRQVGRMNPDGTSFVAGHAGKAAVHLLDQVGADFEFSLQSLPGQSHPPARRRRLVQILSIRWANRQA